ncbi:MAG: pyrroloquinoline quinone biosynthesis peptide chaperone PqqD [Hyphomicrobium zavarzinii]|jgi:pyrroloquinoline quinone biosynthesis protein D|uniref:pyrroloquinoline quinone biosynthesis peptide chaperone PqqD n=1 Tax=Hyphomicrobium TaxID=81 RepID=UPI00036FEDEA|nr:MULTISPECIES: pyrroloquinoline quinone biosynthesis peptide chaperone PqqD [Hyphomicrobium]MBL8845881.1 pyrroloquinoline quinone biosynthesis peptide chaperone PqqD [Hyphomicrobium zavarzinii]WBT39714.1 pyrroloquinoline quinone biosynthesis peptide chaperone PqqD [Hyphomicrobium sp. DMF-1]HML43594.1 pyrroloquinoline quinone biosynthesis peptide chaperone PqqD [Hyphomicrobium zavarzinii]
MDVERRLRPEDVVELNPNYHFRWEEPQQAHVLLYPEGIVKLNTTAAAILEACTGAPSIAAGTAELARRYQKRNLSAEVLKFLEVAHAKGWIRLKS